MWYLLSVTAPKKLLEACIRTGKAVDGHGGGPRGQGTFLVGFPEPGCKRPWVVPLSASFLKASSEKQILEVKLVNLAEAGPLLRQIMNVILIDC
jgi:hypothetical protein